MAAPGGAAEQASWLSGDEPAPVTILTLRCCCSAPSSSIGAESLVSVTTGLLSLEMGTFVPRPPSQAAERNGRIYRSGVRNATLAGGAMRFKLAGAIGLGLLLVIMGASAASATTNTITVGSTATLTSRLLISVPVTVVCDPLTDSFIDASVSVNVQQANGRQIANASGTVLATEFSGATNFLTCDGVTQNNVVVQATPNPGSPPFHGGPALVTASFTVEYGIIFPGCCFQVTNSDSGSSPITTVSLHG